MILCTAQMAPSWQDPHLTLSRMEERIAEAVECDASLIAFPEQVVTGWDPQDATREVQDEEGPIISTLRKYAREYSIGILGSYRQIHHPRPRNTAVAIGPGGDILARYSKIHLFSPAGEDQGYSPGDGLGVFSIEGCRCGIAICYDLRFADLFRLYREVGVHLVLVPSAWPHARMKHFDLFTTSRAAEFQIFVAGINTFGVTPIDRYSGGSVIAGPDGSVISRGCTGEELIFTEIDPEVTESLRRSFPVHQDRMDPLYRRLSREM